LASLAVPASVVIGVHPVARSTPSTIRDDSGVGAWKALKGYCSVTLNLNCISL
jgi:hypothetical protein